MLEIKNPLELSLSIMEIDERIPSFMCRLDLLNNHPTGSLAFNANDVWIACEAWDNFLNETKRLLAGEVASASLASMGNGFSLSISHLARGSEYTLSVKIKEPETGFGSIKAVLEHEVDSDTISVVIRKFTNFDKWW
ncbi:hypothetical protein [Salinarimonas sp.]|uniref:hypothetical protein n=1 Tax=Salinarimonas sp. TaxID=2766526 RepID=UPI00391C9A77